jgi:hypothetical protein
MVRSTHPFEQEEVMAYLDGELAPERAARVAAHLQECAQCESLAASLRGISSQLASWTVEPPSARLAEAVTAAAEEKARANSSPGVEPVTQAFPNSLWIRRRPWAWALAGALTILLLIYVSIPHLLRSRMAAYEAGAERESPLQVGDSKAVAHTRAERATKDYKQRLSGDVTNTEVPLIARTASLSLIVKDFGPVEAGVKVIAEHHKGYIAELNTTIPQNSARKLTATLRIPSPQLEVALAELKQLGRVEQESQSGEDVSKQYTDLAARLKNSRITEQRLLDVLRDRTGKVKDILETEQEIERVRGEIEQMEADQRGLQKRIDFATIQLSVAEDYKASLQAPPTTGTRFHNAAVEGFRSVIDGSIELILWLLEAGPSLLLWVAILFFTARWAWKRWQRSESPLKASIGA